MSVAAEAMGHRVPTAPKVVCDGLPAASAAEPAGGARVLGGVDAVRACAGEELAPADLEAEADVLPGRCGRRGEEGQG